MVTIRPYLPADRAGVRSLHDRTPPAGSGAADGPQPWPPDLDRIPESYLAFWVAVESDGEREKVVGMVGAAAPDPGLPAPVLRGRTNLVQLKRMRVAPQRQRRGSGARLTEAVVAWVRARGAEAVILETTARQAAAVALYRHMGFREVGRSISGVYELVWLELALMAVGADAEPR